MGEILFLAHRLPFPPDRGDRIRSYNILKRLAEIAPVHLGCFADTEGDLAHLAALEPLLASSHVEVRRRSRIAGALSGLARGTPLSLSLFESAPLRAYVSETLATRPIGCTFAFSGQMAQFVPNAPRFVMDFVDVDSAKFAGFAKTATPPLRWVFAREARLLAAFEQAVARRADVSLFVSEAEAALFRAQSGLGKGCVTALENGVDLEFFDPATVTPAKAGVQTGPVIAFTGQMDYRPNIEAVTDFATHTLPLIRQAVPDATFVIVGRAPTPAVTALARLPGVTVTGAVADVRPWLAAAAVIVAPLRLARGVQNKVLEAMAMARPVVASAAAFEGIDAQAGRDLIVADGAADEAAAVLGLLADPHKRHAIGTAAHARMIAHYGWDARLATLPAIVGMPTPMLQAAE